MHGEYAQFVRLSLSLVPYSYFAGLSRTRTIPNETDPVFNEAHVLMCKPQGRSRISLQIMQKGVFYDTEYGHAVCHFNSELNKDEEKAQADIHRTGMVFAEIDTGRPDAGGRVYFSISTMGATRPFRYGLV